MTTETEQLLAYFSAYSPLSPEEQQSIVDSVALYTASAGQRLINVGDANPPTFFVLRGCLRQYVLQENGTDRTTEFYTANDITQVPIDAQGRAEQWLECLEDDTLVAAATQDRVDSLYVQHPRFVHIALQVMDAMINEHIRRQAQYKTETAEQRYLRILQQRPGLLASVPQYHLASYLGIQPESLSRIRRRLAEKTDTD